ncbi:hypothetical protein N9Y42_06090 [Mariniblastus sp.]|nr:hypothetical protein [Mariniblastus sp.]
MAKKSSKQNLIEFTLPDGIYDETTKVWHTEGRLRPPTQKDRTVVIKVAGDIDNRAYRETILLSLILQDLGDLEINESNRQELVEELTVRDVDHLSRLLHRWHYEPLTENTLRCPSCGEKWMVEFISSDQPL